MKKRWMAVCILLTLCVVMLCSCSAPVAPTVIEMSVSKNYDTDDPFVNEKLIYVSEDIDDAKLDVTFQMKGESGKLEIMERESEEVLWSDDWSGDVAKNTFVISLDSLKKEKEYVVRFTGTGIEDAKLSITSQSSLVKERERPQKSNKGA